MLRRCRPVARVPTTSSASWARSVTSSDRGAPTNACFLLPPRGGGLRRHGVLLSARESMMRWGTGGPAGESGVVRCERHGLVATVTALLLVLMSSAVPAQEEAGVEVTEYRGREISLKGGGGPTCLTRPLWRAFGAPRG